MLQNKNGVKLITIVTGLPRSGTSLMMQILNAGGMEILSDNIRKPDISNPKGYYEFEKVKSLQKDNSWIASARGKVIKVIAQLITSLPLDYSYKVIVMKRKIDEIMISQDKMIENLGGKKALISNDILKKTFLNHLKSAEEFLAGCSNFESFSVNYNMLFDNGESIITEMNSALNLGLDMKKACDVIDASLYRNRSV